MIGLFPHLLREIEMTFRRFEIRIDPQGDGAVDDELCWVKEGHKEGHRVLLVFRHARPVLEVVLKGDLMREPRIADGLCVEVVSPFVANGVEIHVVRSRFADESHRVLIYKLILIY